jgi:hypothetical protein
VVSGAASMGWSIAAISVTVMPRSTASDKPGLRGPDYRARILGPANTMNKAASADDMNGNLAQRGAKILAVPIDGEDRYKRPATPGSFGSRRELSLRLVVPDHRCLQLGIGSDQRFEILLQFIQFCGDNGVAFQIDAASLVFAASVFREE